MIYVQMWCFQVTIIYHCYLTLTNMKKLSYQWMMGRIDWYYDVQWLCGDRLGEKKIMSFLWFMFKCDAFK